MIYHFPYPLSDQPAVGSQLFTYAMLQAFRAIGYEVEVITGYQAKRRADMRRIEARLAAGGARPDFLYSESTTSPTLLNETHHLPTAPLLDFGFLSRMKRLGIPLGLRYRDIHWRFALYRQAAALYKRLVAYPFYYYDLLQYRRLLDKLYLPSAPMQAYLPIPFAPSQISLLPPGCRSDPWPPYAPLTAPLRLFYVGGVTPPLYDLRAFVAAVQQVTGVELTLVCRPDEWQRVGHLYLLTPGDGVTIAHAVAAELPPLYAEAHLFSLGWTPMDYHRIVNPVKIYEALGYGLPIAITSGSPAAEFVEREGVGWLMEGMEGWVARLENLRDHPEQLLEKRARMAEVRPAHTWEARARQVAEELCGPRP